MNKIKQLLLITLISLMAIFSSCGDDDVSGLLPCLQCTFPEVDSLDSFGVNAELNADWTNICVGDTDMVDTDVATVDVNGEEILDEYGFVVYEMEEITYTEDLIKIEQGLYEAFFNATCTLVDKD